MWTKLNHEAKPPFSPHHQHSYDWHFDIIQNKSISQDHAKNQSGSQCFCPLGYNCMDHITCIYNFRLLL